MASITEYLVKLQELTQTNLEILSSLNEAFFSRKDHLAVNVGDEKYAIPSFISLENKINMLQENFNNLINSPVSGEAFFNMDGNSRSICVRPYTHTPNSLTLDTVSEFAWEGNDIFKDFMTPIPYINVNLQSLPNDITHVMMKKIVPINRELVELFESNLSKVENEEVIYFPSVQYSYKDIYKILQSYTQDVDYIEYESKLDMPIRKNIGNGVYVIEKIVEDVVDENLDNYITIKFRSDLPTNSYMNTLKYRLFDETIEKNLKVGDKLVTWEGNAKMEITSIKSNSNTITIKVLNGEYLNLMECDTNNPHEINNLSKIRFYSPIDFNDDKYVKVPLEEDKYVFIALAPLNDRMNVQSSWGSGLMVNTHLLLCGDKDFNSYYKENVRNVGDALFEVTSLITNSLTKNSDADFKTFSNLTPIINQEDIVVSHINKHLNDSTSVKNIRSLYTQKKDLMSQREELNESIGEMKEKLSQVSFDDTTGLRTIYTSKLNELNAKKNEINTSITKILDEISKAANNSETPIENAKYRIRGFFDYTSFLKDKGLDWLVDHVKGIRVQYRYKNVEMEQGTAMSVGDRFIFSDWNNMQGFDRQVLAEKNPMSYSFYIEDNNDLRNEPSFNQIDIPISQGETVDIRLKLVYDFGYPFVSVYSQWSPIVNIKFPEEYLKDVQVMDIIEENNNDIETNRFKNILKEDGVSEHIGDEVTDQDITYFHKPDNIASGFFTSERRIIPLKDKLSDLDSKVIELYDEVMGTAADQLQVSIKIGDSQNILYPYQTNNISVASYDQFDEHRGSELISQGSYNVDLTDSGVQYASVVLNLSIINNSRHAMKLFSIFPGDRDKEVYSLVNGKFNKNDYSFKNGEGVWVWYPSQDPKKDGEMALQRGNQFIYFRLNNAFDGTKYYAGESSSISNMFYYMNDVLSAEEGKVRCKDFANNNNNISTGSNFAFMYPSIQDRYGLHLGSSVVNNHIVLNSGEEIIIPIVFEYSLKKPTNNEIVSISKTMSFDLRHSLYADPVNYTFKVTAKYNESYQDKILASNKTSMYKNWVNDGKTKFNSTFK